MRIPPIVLPMATSALAASWTKQMAAGLYASGVCVEVIRLDTVAGLRRVLNEPLSGLIMGPLESTFLIDGRPLYELLEVPLYYFSGDAVFYDLMYFPRLRDFLARAHDRENTVIGQCDAGAFDFFGRGEGGLFPDSSLFVPHGAFARVMTEPEPRARPRFCIFANIGQELSQRGLEAQLIEFIDEKAPRSISLTQRRDLAEVLLSSEAPVAPYEAIPAVWDVRPLDLLEPDLLALTCALDSWVKRARRQSAVRSLVGQPVDFYGEGWKEYFGEVPGFRYRSFVDHDEIGEVLAEYTGVVNLTTNWAHGLHERVYTALAAGIHTVTPVNPALNADHLPQHLIHGYDERRPDLGPTLQRILDEGPHLPVPQLEVLVHHGWQDRMARFLLRRDATELESSPVRSPGAAMGAGVPGQAPAQSCR